MNIINTVENWNRRLIEFYCNNNFIPFEPQIRIIEKQLIGIIFSYLINSVIQTLPFPALSFTDVGRRCLYWQMPASQAPHKLYLPHSSIKVMAIYRCPSIYLATNKPEGNEPHASLDIINPHFQATAGLSQEN